MLNKINKKLIYELDVDSFQSNSMLSKKLRISKQLITYHINSLEKQGVLRKVYVIIDLEKLGYSGQKVYFQMKNLSGGSEAKIINYFKKHNNIAWFGLYDGMFDFVVSIFARGNNNFSKILEKIQTDLFEYIIDFSIASYTNVFALKKKYFLPNKKESEEQISLITSKNTNADFDELDLKILKIICKKSRISSLKVAQKLNVKADTIIRRIKNLKKEGIIQGSRAMIDKQKLDIIEKKILLQLKGFNKEINNKFLSYAKKQKNIVSYITCIGSWNIELDLEMFSEQRIHEILTDIKTIFAEQLVRLNILNLYDEYKYNFYPFE